MLDRISTGVEFVTVGSGGIVTSLPNRSSGLNPPVSATRPDIASFPVTGSICFHTIKFLAEGL